MNDDRTVPDAPIAIFEHASGMLMEFCLFEANGQPVLGRGPSWSCGERSDALCHRSRLRDRSRAGWPVPGARTLVQAGSREGTDGDLDQQAVRTFSTASRAVSGGSAMSRRDTARPPSPAWPTSLSPRANGSIGMPRLTFTNCDEANRLLQYSYRKPWTLIARRPSPTRTSGTGRRTFRRVNRAELPAWLHRGADSLDRRTLRGRQA